MADADGASRRNDRSTSGSGLLSLVPNALRTLSSPAYPVLERDLASAKAAFDSRNMEQSRRAHAASAAVAAGGLTPKHSFGPGAAPGGMSIRAPSVDGVGGGPLSPLAAVAASTLSASPVLGADGPSPIGAAGLQLPRSSSFSASSSSSLVSSSAVVVTCPHCKAASIAHLTPQSNAMGHSPAATPTAASAPSLPHHHPHQHQQQQQQQQNSRPMHSTTEGTAGGGGRSPIAEAEASSSPAAAAAAVSNTSTGALLPTPAAAATATPTTTMALATGAMAMGAKAPPSSSSSLACGHATSGCAATGITDPAAPPTPLASLSPSQTPAASALPQDEQQPPSASASVVASAPMPDPCVSEPGHNVSDSPLGRAALAGVVEGLSAACVLTLLCAFCLLPNGNDATGTGGSLPSASLAARIIVGGVCGLAVAVTAREWVKRTAYRRHWDRERAREAWELDNFPQGEQGEMVELYMARGGMSHEDALTAVCALSKYQPFFVDLMMTQELGMNPPEPAPALNACITGVAFLSAGLPPALAGVAVMRWLQTATPVLPDATDTGAPLSFWWLSPHAWSPASLLTAVVACIAGGLLLLAASFLSVARHKGRVALALLCGMAAAAACAIGAAAWVVPSLVGLPLPLQEQSLA